MTYKMLYSIVRMSDYKISEKDIDGMLNYLKKFDSSNANREYAEDLLRFAKSAYRDIALAHIDKLEDIKKAFDGSKSGHPTPE